MTLRQIYMTDLFDHSDYEYSIRYKGKYYDGTVRNVEIPEDLFDKKVSRFDVFPVHMTRQFSCCISIWLTDCEVEV